MLMSQSPERGCNPYTKGDAKKLVPRKLCREGPLKGGGEKKTDSMEKKLSNHIQGKKEPHGGSREGHRARGWESNTHPGEDLKELFCEGPGTPFRKETV